MGLRQVHEYTVDRAKMTARIGQVNPRRTYIRGRESDENYYAPIQVQVADGETHFYDQGGTPLERELVPAYILADLLRNPVRKGQETVEQVLKFCPYCPSPDNAIASGIYETHLLEHLRQAGAEPAKVEPQVAAKKKR